MIRQRIQPVVPCGNVSFPKGIFKYLQLIIRAYYRIPGIAEIDEIFSGTPFTKENQQGHDKSAILKFINFFLIFFVVQFRLTAQDEDADLINIIETLIPVPEEEISYEDLYDRFFELKNRPLNLNRVTHTDLQSLYILSETEIEKILEYRDQTGDLYSIYELYHIEGLDSGRINYLIPFVTVGDSKKDEDTLSLFHRIANEGKNSFILRYSRLLEKKQGFKNRNDPGTLISQRYYTGSPEQVYGRLAFNVPGDMKIGLTFEKDPGEAYFINPSKKMYFFDHYAGHVQLINRGLLKNLIIGDFTFHAGQGLIAGNNFFLGKGSESVSTVKRFDGGLKPYQGATESGFFRGLGVTLGNNRWEISGYVSRKAADAILDHVTDTIETVITSVLETGYHRTPLEIERRKNIFEISAGIKAAYFSGYKNFTIGMAGMIDHFNFPVMRNPTYYNQYEFSGSNLKSLSLYYDYYKGKWDVFGEVAWSGKGPGFVQGLMVNINEYLEAAIHFRYFDKKYNALHGNAFGEYNANNNEKGMYTGLKIHPFPRFHINGYFDWFWSPWMRYRIASPSRGSEWLVQFNYHFPVGIDLSLTGREETKYRNLPKEDNPEYTVKIGHKKNIYLNVKYKGAGRFKIDSGIQGSIYDFNGNAPLGYSLVQDIGYSFDKADITTRFAYFNASEYDVRQFVYENDLLYYFSIPAYYGKGYRIYALINFKISDNIRLWLKAAQFIYMDRMESGSGLDRITGNKKTEIRCQVQLKF